MKKSIGIQLSGKETAVDYSCLETGNPFTNKLKKSKEKAEVLEACREEFETNSIIQRTWKVRLQDNLDLVPQWRFQKGRKTS